MKKWLSIVLILCMLPVMALADGNPWCQHFWIWQDAGPSNHRMLPVGDGMMQDHIMFVMPCMYCGATGSAPTYIPNSAAPKIPMPDPEAPTPAPSSHTVKKVVSLVVVTMLMELLPW